MKFALSQNYPNPFNPVTKIDYDLPSDSYVSIRIYDIAGRQMESLVNQNQQAGYYTAGFSASSLSSGVYFYWIEAKGINQSFSAVKKMMILK